MTGEPEDDYALGLTALDSHAYAEAREHFTAALDTAVTWEALYARAWVTVVDSGTQTEETLAEAAVDLDRAMALNKGSADVAMLRGDLAVLLREYEEAVRYFLMAIGRTPQRTRVERGLVEALNELLLWTENDPGRPDAIDLCDRVERMIAVSDLPAGVRDSLVGEVVATRAFVYQHRSEDEAVEDELRRLAVLVPGHPRLPARVPTAKATAPTTVGQEEPTFDSIGGGETEGTFAAELRQVFDVYLNDPDPDGVRRKLARFGQSPSRSILLFGPSGCGKTYIVRAFSGEYRRRHGKEIPLIKIKLDEVYGRYVGDNEQNLTRLFDRAIEMQPTILFCDEVDAMGSSREAGESWRQETTGHFLQQVDRLKEEGAAVIFFGCTNRVWAVDLALLRRFDRLIPAELPNEKTRAAIFGVHIAAVAEALRSDTIDLETLAQRSHGLTPGDIKSVVARATDDLLSSGEGATLTQQRLLDALRDRGELSHVQEWMRQSLNALRQIGQNEMAATVEKLYGPFVDDMQAVALDPLQPRPLIPFDAWTEPPVFDLSVLRRSREHT
ncbi:ATP-binding protein [Longispora sp. K20-0274]|uniref:AAA family ATPase n=1 Tax=Longispora sp. K20-0274 TaxID=3088255 RepID=UPI00399B132E